MSDDLFIIWLYNKFGMYYTDFEFKRENGEPLISYKEITTERVHKQPLSHLLERYRTEYEKFYKQSEESSDSPPGSPRGGYKTHIKRNCRKSHKGAYRKKHIKRIKRTKKHHK